MTRTPNITKFAFRGSWTPGMFETLIILNQYIPIVLDLNDQTGFAWDINGSAVETEGKKGG